MDRADRYQERSHVQGLESWKYKGAHLPTPAQIAFKNILFATDFSSTTGLALPYAVEIARRSGATIHAVHVVHPDIYPLVPPSEWPKMAQEEKEFREEKRNQLEEELQGLPHEFLFPAGNVWQNIANIIEDKNIDLLILGTHGRTGMGKVLLGSVAETIFRQAICPVLTVGPAVSSKHNSRCSSRIESDSVCDRFQPRIPGGRTLRGLSSKETSGRTNPHAFDSESGTESSGLRL